MPGSHLFHLHISSNVGQRLLKSMLKILQKHGTSMKQILIPFEGLKETNQIKEFYENDAKSREVM